jgi:hypothetical protein
MAYSVNPMSAILGSTNKKQAQVVNKTIKTAKKVAEIGAILATPEIAGTIKGTRAVKVAAEAIAKKKPYVRVSTGVQGKNANITLKATSTAKKAGSPKSGTKATIQRVVNPRQGAAGQATAAGSRAAKKVIVKTGKAAGFVAGATAEKAYQDSKKSSNKKTGK